MKMWYLVQIQSPDFQPDRLLPPVLPPKPLEREKSESKPPDESISLYTPHLKQLERLAKLWAPQFPAVQYQSPGRTSEPVKPNADPPRAPKPPKSPPVLGSPQRWHESRLWKLRCWHDLQFQSPGLLIFAACIKIKGIVNDYITAI